MTKVPHETVAEVLTEKADHDVITHELRDEIVIDIQKAVEKALAEAEEEEKNPHEKKQYVMLLMGANDPDGANNACPEIGWVVQVPESDSPDVALERIVNAAHNYNLSRKGRQHPVHSFGEACEVVPGRFLVDQAVWVKTKLPAQVVTVPSNELPARTSE